MIKRKMTFLILTVLVTACLSSCAKANVFTEDEQKKALDKVMSFFEDSQERVFTIIDPVKIDDTYCVAVEAAGKYDNGTYLLDTFAINTESDLFYYKAPSGNYERFQNTPRYAYAVSPDKKLCIESTDIAGGGHGGNGDQYLGTTRLLDMSTAEAVWEESGATRERYLWSEDGKYVARQYSGRTWTEVSVIDAETLEVTALPASEEVLAHTDFAAAPASYLYEFKIGGWLSETMLKIDFGWSDVQDHRIQGSYNYSVPDKSFDVVDIEETAGG